MAQPDVEVVVVENVGHAVVVAYGTTAVANATIEVLDCPARRQSLEWRTCEAAQRHFDSAIVAAHYRGAILGSTAPRPGRAWG